MKLITAEQMRRLDAAAIAGGIPGAELMERAGRGLAEVVRRMVTAPGPIGVVLGAGNNAGDGLVAARYLHEWGYQVILYMTTSPDALRPSAQANWERLPDALRTTTIDTVHATHDDFARCACVIDALLGIGLADTVRDLLRGIIEQMNSAGVPIIAVDIPSGLSADTGMPLGCAVCAHTTVTFGLPKLGLVLPPGPEYAGHIEVVDLGLPTSLCDAIASPYHLNTPQLFMPAWPQRPREGHKGTFGHALVIAGSRGMIGAGFLAAKAVLRVGAGLVTYALAETAYEKFDANAAEVMIASLPDGRTGAICGPSQVALLTQMMQKAAVAIGPGLGRAGPTMQTVREIIPAVEVPLVIDADALYAVSEDLSCLRHRAEDVILTPHPGEMSRLCGKTTDEIVADRLHIAKMFAHTHGVHLVLKGHRTVMASPSGALVINATGNAGMATAGAGDVLTGVLTGLLAQGMPIQQAMYAGVYLHGLAGDLAAAHKGEQGMIASDIIESLPQAIQLLRVAQ